MKETRLFYTPQMEDSHELPAEESAHAVRVLRMKEGDSFMATDGEGHFYRGVITMAHAKGCSVEITGKEEAERLWRGGIHVAVAPTKNMDRMEWLAEKATEIGLDSLTFISCRNSERRAIKEERIEKIIVAAMKQSRKARKPRTGSITPFEAMVRQPFDGQKFIAHCLTEPTALPSFSEAVSPEGNTLILIGPEGDFTKEEVETAVKEGFHPVNLGKSRLRTETAALVAVHLMNLTKSIK